MAMVSEPIEVGCQPNPTISIIERHVKDKPANHVYSDHETPILKPLLQQVEDELNSCEREGEEKSTLWALREQSHGMIKPSIRRLPTELLFLIFNMCKTRQFFKSTLLDDDGEYDTILPSCTTVLLISHVCSRWRAITFSSPTLWSNIQICFTRSHNQDDARRIHEFTEFCLGKSQLQPLYIHFDTPDFFSEDDDDEEEQRVPFPSGLHHQALAKVLKHSHRWKDVTLNIQDGDIIDFPGSLPLVESLRIRWAEREDVGEYSHDEVDCRWICAPRLRRLELAGDEEHVVLRFHTRNLVRLSTSERRIDYVLNILKDCPALVDFCMSECLYLPAPAPAPEHVTYHLRSLEMQYSTSTRTIFPFISLPSLTTFKICGFGSETDGDHSALLQFLQRSRPPLLRLQINSISLTSEELASVLSLFPSISRLELRDCASSESDRRLVTNTLFLRLTRTCTGSANTLAPEAGDGGDTLPLLPNLDHLTLDIIHGPVDGKLLVDMVQSRAVGGDGMKQLQFFSLKCLRQCVDNRSCKRLSKLGDGGLVGEVFCCGYEESGSGSDSDWGSERLLEDD
ncbi:hypothetical protein Moror_9492 [Moniliophthora roreri MCA 2997]|nr:hypothetical protein Moror_9492 [Moniliophthora roreri MCA 2997]KAI3599062.1 hypothetical protein WG66_004071 [Moniliophthora roreri]